MSQHTQDMDQVKLNISSILQSVATALMVAVLLWSGNTLYDLSKLIAVNVAVTNAMVRRLEQVEYGLSAEKEARLKLEIEMARSHK